ncbi:hypothetical protein [Paenibacillus sp. LHD-38]|uniref:hypothetical protein n=1 Tax=Paenibacillus sp. LHD-38 TaxID=3072143 RepID=UPI00280FF608|nr:hypothetical protein [Paenibacillus sp. LHD-38]MDQ8739415.1 hypothetical protein [Paenibacillus sp. LHD-38]
MSKVRHGYVLRKSISILLIFLVSFATSYAHGLSDSHSKDPEEVNKRVEDLEKRLQQLEPPKPTTIVTLPWEIETEKHYPSETIPISEVLDKGTKIHFNVIKNDPNYKRPVYEEHWHSTYWGGRWSYVPNRIHYALHRLFTTYDIGISGELNFKQNVGIDFPMFQNKTDLDLYIVVFQTTVTDVYTKGNQVIVVGTPERNGVQVLTIKTGDLHPTDLSKLLLIQLATPLGHELDYSLIVYEPPDFWLKQIQKAKERKR